MSTCFYTKENAWKNRLDFDQVLVYPPIIFVGDRLFHFARRRVALLGNHRVLHGLVLFVHNLQWFVRAWVHQFHLQLAELTVFGLIGGLIAQ